MSLPAIYQKLLQVGRAASEYLRPNSQGKGTIYNNIYV